MLIKDEILTLLEVKHNVGTSKGTGKPYDFYNLVLGDDEYNRLQMEPGKVLLFEGAIPQWVFTAAESKSKVACDIEVVPDGFGTKCRIVSMSEAEE
jgi:hypothetical protein